jgi:hypothetical protein
VPITQNPREIAAAIMVGTLVNNHPGLQAKLQAESAEPRQLAKILIPYFRAILNKLDFEAQEHGTNTI